MSIGTSEPLLTGRYCAYLQAPTAQVHLKPRALSPGSTESETDSRESRHASQSPDAESRRQLELVPTRSDTATVGQYFVSTDRGPTEVRQSVRAHDRTTVMRVGYVSFQPMSRPTDRQTDADRLKYTTIIPTDRQTVRPQPKSPTGDRPTSDRVYSKVLLALDICVQCGIPAGVPQDPAPNASVRLLQAD